MDVAELDEAQAVQFPRQAGHGEVNFPQLVLAPLNEHAESGDGKRRRAHKTMTLGGIAAFNIFKVVKMNSEGNEEINAFKGLVKRNPLMAGTMTLALLSMAGIPPLAGFMAKYLIFTIAVSNGFIWLVVIAILASLVGVYYYFKIIIAMFGGGNDGDSTIQISWSQKLLLTICSLAMVLLSVFPDVILNLL